MSIFRLFFLYFILLLFCNNNSLQAATRIKLLKKIEVTRLSGDAIAYFGKDYAKKRLTLETNVELNSLITIKAKSSITIESSKFKITAFENTRLYITRSNKQSSEFLVILINGKILIKAKKEYFQLAKIKNIPNKYFIGNYYLLNYQKNHLYISKLKNSILKIRKYQQTQMANKLDSENLSEEEEGDDVSSEFFDSDSNNEFGNLNSNDSTIDSDLTNSDTNKNQPISLNKFFNKQREHIFKSEFSYQLGTFFYLSRPAANFIDQSLLHIDAILNNKSSIKSFQGIIKLSTNIQASNRKDVYQNTFNFSNFRDDHRSYININEIYYQQSNTNYDLTLGKKILTFGKGILYSPSNKFSPSDQMNVLSSTQIGSFISEFDYYIDKSSLSFIIIPFIIPSITPTQNSRWSQQIDDGNLRLTSEYPTGNFLSFTSKQLMIVLSTTFWNSDFEFIFFNGPNNDPVVKKTIKVVNNAPEFSLIKIYPSVTNFSLGFSTTVKKLEIHGEYLVQYASKGLDDSYTISMLGIKYTMDNWAKYFLSESVTFISEFINESIMLNQSAPFFVASSIFSRIYQKSLLGAVIFKISDKSSFNFNYHFDLKNQGSAIVISNIYNLKSGLTLSTSIGLLSGSKNSLMGIWNKNDFISLNLSQLL